MTRVLPEAVHAETAVGHKFDKQMRTKTYKNLKVMYCQKKVSNLCMARALIFMPGSKVFWPAPFASSRKD